jgi:DNA-directed RNA polymerase subunit L
MENLKTSLDGYRIDFELSKVPVPFVNGLRRILLAEIPTVIVKDVNIRDNSSQMIHEMLKHRVEMLPINVKPSEVAVIRDTKIVLHYEVGPEPRLITTDDFAVSSPRGNIILKDRDLGTPLFFLQLKANEGIRLECSLGVATKGASQVCVATFKNHIDPEVAKQHREQYLAPEFGDHDPRIFDNHLIQRSFEQDEHGRPTRFDFAIESIGVATAKELLVAAVEVYKNKIDEFLKEPIAKDDTGAYVMESTTEGHTLGALAQALIHEAGLVDFVSYRIDHPLTAKLILLFRTKVKPETVLERFRTDAMALCETILKSV